MMFDDILFIFESMINTLARKYLNIDGLEFEDLQQIGRLVVWNVVEAKNISKEEVDRYKGYIHTSIENAFRQESRKMKAQKRLNLNNAISLDAEMSDDDSRNLYNKIAVEDIGFVNMDTLIYLKNVALKERNPKAIKGVVYCLVELLDIETSDVPRTIQYDTFIRYGLGRYLYVFFNNSPFLAIRNAYPNFNPHDMKKVPNNYWKGAVGKRRAVKLLVDILSEKKIEERDYPLVMTVDFITKIGLLSPCEKHFRCSPYLFLDAAFPKKFKPWQMSTTPKNFLCKDISTVSQMVNWLLIDKLLIDISKMDQKDIWKQKISSKLTKEVFEKNGLRGLLNIFDNSPEKIIRLVYPNMFMPWDFPSKTKWHGAEGLVLAGVATRWVVEEYCGIQPTNAEIGYRFFVDNGLHGMITSRVLGFNSSPKAALKNAYPDLDFE